MEEEELRKGNRVVEQIVDDMDIFDDALISMVYDGNMSEAVENM